MSAPEREALRRQVADLQRLIDGWSGPPCAPVLGEARMLLGLVGVRIMMSEVMEAAMSAGEGR
ncbi:MAG: hypothetical protein ACREIS_08185 [Nitrospiraceae bacterium]